MAGQKEVHSHGVGSMTAKPEIILTGVFLVVSQLLDPLEARHEGISRKGRGVSLM